MPDNVQVRVETSPINKSFDHFICIFLFHSISECLEELGQMIEAIGLNPFNPAVTLKEIAKQISDRDTSVRNAALNTITVAYQIAGDPVFKYIGKVSMKLRLPLSQSVSQ